MEINWNIIIIVGILAIALVIFLIWRNQKDEKEMEKEMNTPKKAQELENNDSNDSVY